MIENLNKDQIQGIFDAMPVDFIFVDEKDCLRYWNKTETRRRKAPVTMLGRDIRLCHKKESLPMVEEILADFKSGKRDEAEFCSTWGHPLKGHCQEEKVFRMQERAIFFLAVNRRVRTAPRFSTSLPLLKFLKLMCQHCLHCTSHPSGSRSLKDKECNGALPYRISSRPLPPLKTDQKIFSSRPCPNV